LPISRLAGRKPDSSVVIEEVDISDAHLLELFRTSGDTKYRNELFSRHLQSLLWRCLQITHNWDRAEDLAHDCIVTALERLNQCQQNFGAWLSAIAWHTWLNHQERGRREQSQDEVVERVSEEPNPEQEAAQSERRRQLLAAIQELPERQRICLKLYYLNELDPAAIARQTGWPVREVHRLLENGKKCLKRRLHHEL
jgi:RNA polymerase sigma-70 factor (ECF subfamily)